MLTEYRIYCPRAERLSLDAVTRMAPSGMSVRAATALDGFVVESKDVAIGVFICNAEKLERAREHFVVEGPTPPPADVFARIKGAQMLLEITFIRGQPDQRSEQLITELLRHVDGCIHRHDGIYDANGDNLTPQQVTPPAPPDEARIRKRAFTLAALAMRSSLEDGPRNETEKLLQRLRLWLQKNDVFDELADDERSVIEAPLGALDHDAVASASWLAEGLGAIAWACGLIELPSFDVAVAPAKIAAQFGFLSESSEAVPIRLRHADERKRMRDRMFAVRWRLQQFLMTHEAMDFEACAKTAWFGPLELSELHLVKSGPFLRKRLDLAIRRKSLAETNEHTIAICLETATERWRALTWLDEGGSY